MSPKKQSGLESPATPAVAAPPPVDDTPDDMPPVEPSPGPIVQGMNQTGKPDSRYYQLGREGRRPTPSSKSPLVNPDAADPYIDNDPLRKMLSENGVGWDGFEEPGDSIPDELAAFMEENNFSVKSFQIVLKRVPVGAMEGTASNASYVQSWTRTIPSQRIIKLEYGPVNYYFQVIWAETIVDEKTGSRGTKRHHEILPFSIDESCELEYLNHQREKRLQAAIKMREKAQQAKLNRRFDKEVFGDDIDLLEEKDKKPVQSVKEYVSEVAEAAKALGMVPAGGAPNNGPKPPSFMEQLLPMLPMIVPGISALMKLSSDRAAETRNQMQAMMMMMLTKGESHNAQIIELMKAAQGQGSGASLMKEVMGLVMGAVDLKRIVQGEPETLGDKIFSMLEKIMPQLLAVVAMSKAQPNAPQVVMGRTMAQAYMDNDPDFGRAMGDPVESVKMFAKLDDLYGWRQIDELMAAVGKTRPANCMRDPSKELPMEDRAVQGQPAQDDRAPGDSEDGELVPDSTPQGSQPE
jgi:hypothetical protein